MNWDKYLSRRNFLKWTGLASAAFLAACSGPPTPATPTSVAPQETPTPIPFKERIERFTWNDAQDREKFSALVQAIGDGYLHYYGTKKYTKTSELISPERLIFCHSRAEFVLALSKFNFQPRDSLYGYTDYDTDQVFIDLESLKKQANEASGSDLAGPALLDVLWHEWKHRDTTPRTSGVLINNPEVAIPSPNSGNVEQIRSYRGGQFYTDTYFGLAWFDEVLVESVTLMKMLVSVGMSAVHSAGDYFYNGTNVLVPLAQLANITPDELYTYHATSDLDGLAERLGSLLPGEAKSQNKGFSLFVALHTVDVQQLTQLGVFEVIDKARKEGFKFYIGKVRVNGKEESVLPDREILGLRRKADVPSDDDWKQKMWGTGGPAQQQRGEHRRPKLSWSNLHLPEFLQPKVQSQTKKIPTALQLRRAFLGGRRLYR